jgi:hypothetical protein
LAQSEFHLLFEPKGDFRMSEQLLQDHHLKHFTEKTSAAEYAIELSRLIRSGNWLLIGAALQEQKAVALCFDIEPLGEDHTPYISRIYAVDADGEEIALNDQNLDLMTMAITETDGQFSVGAMELDWPMEMRLAILGREHLDAAHPGWNAPGAGVGTLVIDTDGRPALTRHKRSKHDLE